MLTLLGAGSTNSFSPLSLSPALWLDAADPATLFQDFSRTTPAVSDGDPVGAWSDKSGNGRHCTQATSTRRFTLKTAVQNGRNALRSDGVDDVLTVTLASLPQPFWVFLVARGIKTTGLSADQNFYRCNSGIGPVFYTNSMNSNRFSMFAGTVLGSTPISAGPNAFLQQWNGASSGLYTDGSLSFSGDAGSLTGTGVLGIAGVPSLPASTACGADFCEIVVGSGTLSTPQVASLTTYARSKWGTP